MRYLAVEVKSDNIIASLTLTKLKSIVMRTGTEQDKHNVNEELTSRLESFEVKQTKEN